jgi:hypothetical protein
MRHLLLMERQSEGGMGRWTNVSGRFDTESYAWHSLQDDEWSWNGDGKTAKSFPSSDKVTPLLMRPQQ